MCDKTQLFNVSACGQSQHTFNPYDDLTLIHYGYNSSRGDFPWMAALYTPLDAGKWEQICGGTLISPGLVLSGTFTVSSPPLSFIPHSSIHSLCTQFCPSLPGPLFLYACFLQSCCSYILLLSLYNFFPTLRVPYS